MPYTRPYNGKQLTCITVPELVECGVSEKYLVKKALPGQRDGLYTCWPHHKEGRTIYIHYSGIREEYQQRIKARYCEGMEPDEWLALQKAKQTEEHLQQVYSSIPDMLQVDPETIAKLRKIPQLSPSDAQKIARGEAWLRLYRSIDVKKVRAEGCKSITEMQQQVFNHYLNDLEKGWIKFPKPVKSLRVLDRLARRYGQKGLECLLHPAIGNQNRAIIDQKAHAVLINLASEQVKYSFEDIGLLYNVWATENNSEKVTVSAIKKHLYKPDNFRVWYYNRHGEHAGNNVLQQLIERNRPSRPDALWSVDGTTVQLYYRDDKGKIRSDLYAVFVTDAYSLAIIGAAVAYTETGQLVTEAFRNCLDTHGYKPYQVQYDNSKANVNQAVQDLITNMAHVHFPCKPYSGRSKYVESIIGHFQQRVLRHLPNFKGGNVTTRSLNSKANPELLSYLKENISLLPDMEGAIAQFYKAIAEYNIRGESRDGYGNFTGRSRIEMYNEAHADREKINYFEKLSLFMVSMGEKQYGQYGVELTISGKTYRYSVPDSDTETSDFIFASQNRGIKFQVRANLSEGVPANVMLYDSEGRHVADAYERERYASCIADLKPGEMGVIRQLEQKQQEYGYTHAQAELNRQRQLLIDSGLMQATGTDGFGFWDSSKLVENIRQNRKEDQLNGLSDTVSDLEKALMKLGG